MSKWKECSLGEVLQFQRGFDLLARERHEGNIPVVSSSGITGYHNQAKAIPPGVIIGRKGTLGTVHYVDTDYWPHDTTLWVRDFKGNSPKFIYYFLQLMHLENYDVGASNPTLNRNHIHKLKLKFPPLPVQRKIAAVLSAYDDLIENNTRRIVLLEKMAEEIYREWFLRLRFPGHEQVTFNKGIPQGWEVAKLGEIAEKSGGVVQTGPFGAQLHQSDYQSDGIPVIMPKDIQGNRINSETVAFISEQLAQKLSRHILKKGDIVFPRRGDLSKRFLVTANEDGWLCGTGCLKINIPPQALSPWYLFYFLSQSHITDFIESKAIGATMANVNASILKSVELLCPGYSIQEKFNRIIDPISEQVTRLNQVNHDLKKSRDLLLTRLISGKLSVEDLDIHFTPSMTAETPHDG